MLRRNLLHIVRYPGLTVFTIGGPVVFLLLFVVRLRRHARRRPARGRPGRRAGRLPRVRHARHPAMTIAGSAGGTATTVAMDMTEGITARFRTMAISRAAVLAGHVLGNTIQALIARRRSCWRWGC